MEKGKKMSDKTRSDRQKRRPPTAKEKAHKEKEELRTKTKKAAVLEALKRTLGVVSTACEASDCSRSQFYAWREADPEFKAATEEVTEFALDFVESKMMTLINGVKKLTDDGVTIYEKDPDKILIMFYLKTKGKKRGYIERTELDHQSMGEPIIGVKFEK